MPLFNTGTSFWVVGEPNPHLWFIISDPEVDDEHVLYVNLTTYRADARAEAENDPACIVRRGEHAFVKHDSCVYYYGAHSCRLDQLKKRLQRRRIRMDAPADEALLSKMRKGARISRHIALDFLQILEDQGLI